MRTEDDGGPAFPAPEWEPDIAFSGGMTLRDWFATFSPHPSTADIAREQLFDKQRNPYNEPGKPRIRSADEIACALRYRYADNMLAEREKHDG